MKTSRFNVVTDGQWGSCGKGKVSTALVARYRPEMLSTTNMPNAGHTAVNQFGEKFVSKCLPCTAIMVKWLQDYWPSVFIGPTAAFQPSQLFGELGFIGQNVNLAIHPRAGIVTRAHADREAGLGDSPLSTKHIASTMQGSGAFLSDKIMRKQHLILARDLESLRSFLFRSVENNFPETVWSDTIHDFLDNRKTMLHEGSQGFSLDINHGSHYPQCTSRGTTAIQNMVDMGISPYLLGDVYLVIRPFPIRVGNVIEDGVTHSSGDCYPDQKELSWEEVAASAGMDEARARSLALSELTTVTKRIRRVFSFSWEQVRLAARINGATALCLNFADYIDATVYGVKDYGSLTPKIKEYIVALERKLQLPVVFVGTGPRIDQCVWLY